MIVSGQSNAEGYRSDPSLLPVHQKDSEINYSYNRDVFNTPPGIYKPLQPCVVSDGGGNGWTEGVSIEEGYSSYGYGPEITLARKLHSKNNPVAVVKVAEGNTDLNNYWNPQPEGIGWKSLVSYVAGIYNTLRNEGEDPYYLGMVWWQGETDASKLSTSLKYESNLRNFISAVRTITNQPDLPIIICKIVSKKYRFLKIVQNAQKRVTNTTPNTVIYDPSNLSMYSDGVHFWEDAQIKAGYEIAEILKRMIASPDRDILQASNDRK